MPNPFHQELIAANLRQRLDLRSLKRAKSVRDAFPPCTPKRHLSLLAYSDKRKLSQFRVLRRRTDDSIFDVDTPTDSETSFSDSESLPDLSDCTSPGSVHSAVTPTKGPQFFDFTASVDARKRLFQKEVAAGCSIFLDEPLPSFPSPASNPFLSRPSLSIQVPEPAPERPTHAIFSIPELVYKIIEYADAQYTLVPKESSPIRRSQPKVEPEHRSHQLMHSCLLVNKLFNRAAREIMSTRVLFSNEESFTRFSRSKASFFEEMKPRTFVLNKLFYAKQASLEHMAPALDCSELEWLEIFMCPRLKPSPSFFHPALKTLVVTGSKVFDDKLLSQVADKCPNLEVLDIRACELITDCGIYALGKRCRKLRSINFGRKRKGHLITDHSVLPLVSGNANLHTVGLAGCSITDRVIWEIAVNCGKHLERLSLNSCPYIGNQSVPAILSHNLTPKLSVLEIKNIENLTNFDPIVNFKRRQISTGIIMLIETCDKLQARLRECEQKMDSVISQRIFRDISEWANSDDGDLSYLELRASRAQAV